MLEGEICRKTLYLFLLELSDLSNKYEIRIDVKNIPDLKRFNIKESGKIKYRALYRTFFGEECPGRAALSDEFQKEREND